MRLRAALILIASVAGPGLAAAQTVVTSAAPDKVEVTVYRDPERGEQAMNLSWLNGFALISERRRVRLPAGESIVRFEGVAGGIVPQSAIVTGFPDGIVERNRDAYLLSSATLLDRSLGRRVHLRRTFTATGEVREQEAVVRSSAQGAIVVETQDGIESLRCTGLPETLVYDEVPAGLSPRPTLSVRIRSAASVEAEITLSYLATGFDWQANYVAHLSEDGKRLELFAWLTLASTDETSFPNADTQAVAGRPNYERAEVQPVEAGELELHCWPSATTSDIPLEQVDREDEGGQYITVTGSRMRRGAVGAVSQMNAVSAEALVAQQEELGDLKLYRIPEPVTVAANSQKQVALLIRPRVVVDSVFRARIGSDQADVRLAARRFLVTRNRPETGLGMPLPSGQVSLFVQRAGRPFLAGQARLADRAVGEDVEVDFGPAPGIVAHLRRVATDSANRWADYELTVSSDRPHAIRFEAELVRPDATSLTSRTRLGTRDGFALWQVRLAPNGSATLRYRVIGAS